MRATRVDEPATRVERVPLPPSQPTDQSVGRFIHAFTASGIIVGMLALIAVLDGSPRSAVLLLILAQLIDGIDGPLARRYDIATSMPRYNGEVLDLVIDYVTCVLVPATFAWQFRVLPHNVAGEITVALMLTTSALWFSRTDMMTADHWFRGFPGVWNLVVPTLWLLHAPGEITVMALVGLSVLSMSDVEFAHPVQVTQRRRATVSVTAVWIVTIVVLTVLDAPNPTVFMVAVLLLGPLWNGGLTISRIMESRSASTVTSSVENH